MPRSNSIADGNVVFHVLNRAVGRQRLFATERDYGAFLGVVQEAQVYQPMRVLSYCFMPNHWHFVLWPWEDGQLARFMQWLTGTHAQRWRAVRGTTGDGHVYQDRYKPFPVQCDEHFYRVCRYVERNPLRAGLVKRAEQWRWSSLWQTLHDCSPITLHAWPIPRPSDWLALVNEPQPASELIMIRRSVKRGVPYGSPSWRRQASRRLGLTRCW